MVILSLITSSSENACKTLENEIKNVKICDLPGEDVATLTNHLKYVIKHLSVEKGHICHNCPKLKNQLDSNPSDHQCCPEAHCQLSSHNGDKHVAFGEKSHWSKTLNGETILWCGCCRSGNWEGTGTTSSNKHYTNQHGDSNQRANVAVDESNLAETTTQNEPGESSSDARPPTGRPTFSEALSSFQDAAN